MRPQVSLWEQCHFTETTLREKSMMEKIIATGKIRQTKRQLHLGRMLQEKKNQVGAYLIIRIE